MSTQFEENLIKPAFLRVSSVDICGLPSKRLMIVLKTIGCEYARSTGGCTVCGFMNNSLENTQNGEIEQQLNYSLNNTDMTSVGEVDLLTLGSFLNDREVSEETRNWLMKRLSTINDLKRVSIESRAEYVTVDKLKKCKEVLGDKILECGIGLESVNDYIRNAVIKKGLSKNKFEEFIATLKEADVNLLVYILIKPPTTSEKEAIEDAINSAKYVFDVAKKYGVNVRVAFEPVFICSNTELERLFLNSEYKILNLWSVVEVIKRVHEFGSIFVGLSDEDLSHDRMPYTCDLCYDKVVEEIEMFNYTQDITKLCELDCECKAEYEKNIEEGII